MSLRGQSAWSMALTFNTRARCAKVIAEEIQADLAQENVVLITPIGASPTGEIFNLAWEEVAEAVAVAVQADKLIYLCAASWSDEREGRADRCAHGG
jgi:acetylglutamate kinase